MVGHLLKKDLPKIPNQPESASFLLTALAWRGSATPDVVLRVVVVALYSMLVHWAAGFVPDLSMPITPFEYSGAVLTLILVQRLNAGHDRWWEARKIWGSITNQTRNLALVIATYSDGQKALAKELLLWVAAWPHVMRETLRGETRLKEVEAILGALETGRIRAAGHMPLYVGQKIASLLDTMKKQGMDSFAFLRAETERSQLIDAIGACERIRGTRMPLAMVINTRRFILMFLLLLPLSMIDRAGWLTPLVVILTSYPLFSLDEIGAQLQSPFERHSLSHLPLDSICANIAANVNQVASSLD
jgi:putative membrane protein